MIIRIQLQRFLAPLAAAASLLFPTVPLLGVATATTFVAVSEIATPAPSEAKPKWQAFVGPKHGTRRPIKADSLKSLREKVQKRSGKFATQGVQNLRTGEWSPAPYKGKPSIDKFGNNLYQIR